MGYFQVAPLDVVNYIISLSIDTLRDARNISYVCKEWTQIARKIWLGKGTILSLEEFIVRIIMAHPSRIAFSLDINFPTDFGMNAKRMAS